MEFNGWLKGFKADIPSLYNSLTTKSIVTVPELRKAIEKYQAKKEPSIATGFFDHFQEFIEVSKLEGRSVTIAKYKVVMKCLENFNKEKYYPISFDNIYTRFFDLFKAYLIHPLKHTDNTIWKDFAIVKTFMN